MDHSVNYAGFWKRLAAALIDGVVLGFLGVVLVAILAILMMLSSYFGRTGVYLVLNPLKAMLNPQSFGTLFGAFGIFFLDGIVVFFPLFLLFGLFGLSSAFNIAENTTQVLFVMVSAYVIVNWLYHACLESSAKQATFGKQIMKLAVTDLNQQKISFAQATARHFSKMLSTSILCTGHLMAAWTKKNQALQDKIAGCLVCKASRGL